MTNKSQHTNGYRRNIHICVRALLYVLTACTVTHYIKYVSVRYYIFAPQHGQSQPPTLIDDARHYLPQEAAAGMAAYDLGPFITDDGTTTTAAAPLARLARAFFPFLGGGWGLVDESMIDGSSDGLSD